MRNVNNSLEPGLHVGVLYASPLGYYEDSEFKFLAPLSKNEIQSLEALMECSSSQVSDMDFRLSINVGTPQNFMSVA